LPEKYRKLHDYTVMIKGEEDYILGARSFVVRTPGGKKRCGGIGDILAGVTSACSLWNF
jgi:NAD(P)H-hydrate repair Nnr-like enzyme with NAD(P)H-hydrate dehydratase domain